MARMDAVGHQRQATGWRAVRRRKPLDKCQATVSSADACSVAGRAFLQQVPAPHTRLELLILRGLLAEMMLRRAIALRLVAPDCIDLLEAPVVTSRAEPLDVVASRDHHPKVTRAFGQMRRSMADPALRLKDIASAVGLTTCHLSRLLRKETGHGFVSHLRAIRLDAAVAFLGSTEPSVKQIAAAVGYKYAGDFARHFRLRFGTTPSDWRRLHSH